MNIKSFEKNINRIINIKNKILIKKTNLKEKEMLHLKYKKNKINNFLSSGLSCFLFFLFAIINVCLAMIFKTDFFLYIIIVPFSFMLLNLILTICFYLYIKALFIDIRIKEDIVLFYNGLFKLGFCSDKLYNNILGNIEKYNIEELNMIEPIILKYKEELIKERKKESLRIIEKEKNDHLEKIRLQNIVDQDTIKRKKANNILVEKIDKIKKQHVQNKSDKLETI